MEKAAPPTRVRHAPQPNLLPLPICAGSAERAHPPLLRCHRPKKRHPGGDNQGAVRALEYRTESLDGAPVNFTNLSESGEVVDEGSVNHAVRMGRTSSQAFEIFQIASMDLRACSFQRLGAHIGASKTKHLMTGAD
jgi:hypothetical protein